MKTPRRKWYLNGRNRPAFLHTTPRYSSVVLTGNRKPAIVTTAGAHCCNSANRADTPRGARRSAGDCCHLQLIAGRAATADVEPVTVEARTRWLRDFDLAGGRFGCTATNPGVGHRAAVAALVLRSPGSSRDRRNRGLHGAGVSSGAGSGVVRCPRARGGQPSGDPRHDCDPGRLRAACASCVTPEVDRAARGVRPAPPVEVQIAMPTAITPTSRSFSITSSTFPRPRARGKTFSCSRPTVATATPRRRRGRWPVASALCLSCVSPRLRR